MYMGGYFTQIKEIKKEKIKGNGPPSSWGDVSSLAGKLLGEVKHYYVENQPFLWAVKLLKAK